MWDAAQLPEAVDDHEWGDFGHRKPSMRAFAIWLVEVGETHVASIRTLKILHDEFAVHDGRQSITERRLARLVTRSDYLTKYRDGKAANATRYRVVADAMRSQIRAA